MTSPEPTVLIPDRGKRNGDFFVPLACGELGHGFSETTEPIGTLEGGMGGEGQCPVAGWSAVGNQLNDHFHRRGVGIEQESWEEGVEPCLGKRVGAGGEGCPQGHSASAEAHMEGEGDLD